MYLHITFSFTWLFFLKLVIWYNSQYTMSYDSDFVRKRMRGCNSLEGHICWNKGLNKPAMNQGSNNHGWFMLCAIYYYFPLFILTFQLFAFKRSISVVMCICIFWHFFKQKTYIRITVSVAWSFLVVINLS